MILTSWIGNHYEAILSVIAYGTVLLFCAIAYLILQFIIIQSHGKDFSLRKGIGADLKGKISIGMYIFGIGLSFLNTWFGIICYGIVAIMWFIPDRRIEENL